MTRPTERLTRPKARPPGPPHVVVTAECAAIGSDVLGALDRLGLAAGDSYLVIDPAGIQDQARARTTDPRTSHQAAASIDELPKRQRDVLEAFHRWGAMHDEQLVRRYREMRGVRPQSESSIRTRRGELVVQGFLRDSTRKGATLSGRKAIVWETTPRGGGR